jgi:hypothetical protein
MAVQINTIAPIVPNESLGGLRLRTYLLEIAELVRGLGVTTPGRYELASPFEARYLFGDGSVQVAVDVRNGRIFKLIASEAYRGTFGAVRVGMPLRDAIIEDPRLYYDEAEECVLCRGVEGITIDVPVVDPDPCQVPELPISAICVFAAEILTQQGQRGRW